MHAWGICSFSLGKSSPSQTNRRLIYRYISSPSTMQEKPQNIQNLLPHTNFLLPELIFLTLNHLSTQVFLMISIAPKGSMQSDNWLLDEVEFGLHVAINLNSKVRPPPSRHWQPLENDSQSNPLVKTKYSSFFIYINLHLQMQLQTWIQKRSASLTTQKVSFQ